MLDAAELINQHRGKGVFVDTNLLVLLLVGLVNIRRIESFKRTQDFTNSDFKILRRLITHFGTPLLTTPYVLSQVSDLTDLSGRELLAVRERFKSIVETAEEKQLTAKQLVQHPLFERFGLADSSVAAACDRKIVVLTADVKLQLALQLSGHPALDFNHVRLLS